MEIWHRERLEYAIIFSSPFYSILQNHRSVLNLNKQNVGAYYSYTLRSTSDNRCHLPLPLQPCLRMLLLVPTYPTLIQVLLELRALSNVNSSITIHDPLLLFNNLSLILTRNQDCSSSITCLWATYLDSSCTRVSSHLRAVTLALPRAFRHAVASAWRVLCILQFSLKQGFLTGHSLSPRTGRVPPLYGFTSS